LRIEDELGKRKNKLEKIASEGERPSPSARSQWELKKGWTGLKEGVAHVKKNGDYNGQEVRRPRERTIKQTCSLGRDNDRLSDPDIMKGRFKGKGNYKGYGHRAEAQTGGKMRPRQKRQRCEIKAAEREGRESREHDHFGKEESEPAPRLAMTWEKGIRCEFPEGATYQRGKRSHKVGVDASEHGEGGRSLQAARPANSERGAETRGLDRLKRVQIPRYRTGRGGEGRCDTKRAYTCAQKH